MAGVRVDVFRAGWSWALALGLTLGSASCVFAQGSVPGITRGGAGVPDTGPAIVTGPRAGSPDASSPNQPGIGGPQTSAVDVPIDPLIEQAVVDIQFVGNDTISKEKILGSMKTKVGRPFDQVKLENDVRDLLKRGWFTNLRPIREQVAGGVKLTFLVSERPTLAYVKYIGCHAITRNKLAKKTELKKGGPLNPYDIDEGKRKIEEVYRDKGYNDVQVSILEGTKPGDRGAVYLINEGVIQKVWTVKFEGNTIASDKRLRTQIGSKPPILYLFKGQVDRKKIDEDIEKLVAYYRSLGYFRARVGREIQFDSNEKWATLTFVIDEGPRYVIREVKFNGNKNFTTEQLQQGVKLKAGDFFSQGNLNADRTMLTDAYGTRGYVFCKVQDTLGFMEEPGQLDVIFNFEEGSRFTVGRIDVHIAGANKQSGDNPHTRFQTVLNRLQFRPGDIMDTQKIRNAERRLKASALFVADPQKGAPPKITFNPPDADEETGVARRKRRSSDNVRGQSPDDDVSVDEPALLPGESVSISLLPERQQAPVATPGSAASAALPARTAPPVNVSPQAYSDRQPQPTRLQPQLQQPQQRPQPQPYPGPLGPNAAPAVTPAPQPAPPLVIRGQGPDESSSAAAATATNPSAPPALKWRPQPAAAAAVPSPGPGGPRSAIGPPPRPVDPRTALPPNPLPPNSLPPNPLPPTQGPANPLSANPRAATPQASWPAQPSAANVPFETPLVVRGQDSYGGRVIQPLSPASQSTSANPPTAFAPPAAPTGFDTGGRLFGQSPDPNAPAQPGGIIPPIGAPDLGAPPADGGGVGQGIQPEVLPALPIDIDTMETQTGRFMFGAGINSNAGLVGSVVIDEQNFDWKRVPTGWESWRNGTAFRGAGQHFRIELAPGTVVSRYVVSFNEPYLFDTNVNFGISGQFYQRFYNDWVEQRAGGRVSLGYQFRPDLTGVVALRAEAVDIKDPRILIPDLAQVLGITQLYSGQFKLVNDIRDSTFFPTQGRYIEVGFEQAFGSFAFPKATLDMRKFFTVAQRPDGSGRQVLSLYGFLGVTGKNTPIYERFFLGGIGTIRGFYFRGASPTIDTVEVGGDFATYGTIEYTCPITADDMLRGAVFVDAGIDARTSDIGTQDIRVAPGFGVRISVPAMGPAPISIDFAVPVLKSSNDRSQVINFMMGVGR